MILGNGSIDGSRMLLLGLSEENVTRLAAGEPIKVDLRPMGFEAVMVVVYGRTERDIADMLSLTGPATRGNPAVDSGS